MAHACVQVFALNAFDDLQAQLCRVEVLCNDLTALPDMADGHPTTVFLFEEFIRVLAEHFRNQEDVMDRLGYSNLDRHHSDHAAIIGEVLSMQASYRRGRMTFTDSMWRLRALVLKHLNGADQEFLLFSKSK